MEQENSLAFISLHLW